MCSKKFKKILDENKSLKFELSKIKRLLLGKLKADGDILSNKQLNNLQGELSHDQMVDDQYDDPHRPTENERSEKKRRAKEGKNAEGHSDEKEEAAEERVISLGPLNMEEMRQEKNAGVEDLLPFPLVEEFSKSSLYSQLQPLLVWQHLLIKSTQAERSELGGINDDTEDVISDIDTTTKFVNIDSTTCVVEIFHDEQESTRVSPMKSKDSPLKPKGSLMKKRTYIRRKKGSKATISDIASELNSMPSSMKIEAKDATPKKLVRQKFLGQLVKSPYVADFDSGAFQSIFYQKHHFICDIEAFDNLSSLKTDF
ncbi:hypothetical protein FXO38_24304 [Capsicum annuum]|uniref:Uncharacterized protein n=1 Tax=Capsicum annuum TaxID=4072 RepID=A0A2G2Y8T2_CAPAN|nr:hypothetical protein FXO38_24304 [Capsicum annuum]KAF3674007.1 hypothetical protein FXO37_06636 [Capsicum annuum]PHT66089.1 hypothetical protein T459_30514 [Capsicum annuum]